MKPSSSEAQVTAPAGRTPVLVGLLLAMALAAMDTTIVATAIPSIVGNLGGFSLFPWVFSSYLLGTAVSIPLYGKLADLYGRKPLLIFGILLFLVGSILSGLAWNMIALIVFRGLQGLGAGAVQPMTMTIVGDMYNVEERARIQGWLGSVWGISAVIGPALGGFFSDYASWRWIFYLNLPVGIAALFMVSSRLHEQVARKRHKIDITGAALLVLGIGLLILGLLEGGVHWAWTSGPSLALFAAALLLLIAFTFQERRALEPILPTWVFTRRLLLAANFGSMAVGLLTIGLTTYLPTFAQGVLGASAIVAGFILAVQSIGWPTASALSGKLYLRIGFRNTALLGLCLCLLASFVFVLLPQSAPIWAAAIGSFLMGAGLGLLSTPLIVGVQSVVGWERRGVVTGANMFTRMLGSTLGAAIYGGIANSTLASWLRGAPANLQGKLPDSLNDVSSALSGAANHSGPALAFVRDGLYVASHRVFFGLAAVALLGLLVVALAPRRFETLHFGEADSSPPPAAMENTPGDD
jgi:EmrB/QacA subfamily drug resistance transporter